MSKPLVYVKTKIKVDDGPDEFDSWELIAFNDCPIMHAAFNPIKQALVCQFNSAKEGFITVPVQGKNGKVEYQNRKSEQYYRQVITDKEAIQFILDTYTANYNGQQWEVPDDTLVTKVDS